MNFDLIVRRFRTCVRTMLLCFVALAGLCSTAHGQSIQHDIVLVLDNSGSMRKNDLNFLTSVAVRAFIAGLDDDNHLAIVSFDQHVKVLEPLAALNAAHRAALLASLSSINYRGLLSNSPKAIEKSIYELRTHGRANSEKSIIFMTDGIVDVAPEGPDAGDVEKARWMKSTLADEAADRRVRIFGIAFTDNADFELIQTLAKRTNGEYYRAYTAADINGVFTQVRDRLSSLAPPKPPVNIVIAPAPQPTPDTPTGAETVIDPATSPVTVETTTDSESPDSTQVDATGALPDSELPLIALPEISLSGGETTPEVILPGVSLSGDKTPSPGTADPGTNQATPQPPDVSVSPPGPLIDPKGPDSEQGDSDVIDEPTKPTTPLPLDDSKFYIALMVGAAIILLALAALIFVLMRRKPAAAPGSGALMPKAFLNDIAGSTDKPSYEVGAKPIVVGRLQGPDSEAADYIVIEESTIGRRHALIEYTEHSFWVTDQNSLNGTFVNNARAETGVRLKHGDRIRFHKHEFEFLVLDMFETDRTMMSETVYADLSSSVIDDATLVRVDDIDEPSAEDPTVTRP